jgi:hypothetical protein
MRLKIKKTPACPKRCFHVVLFCSFFFLCHLIRINNPRRIISKDKPRLGQV